MDILKFADIKQLIDVSGEWCLSFYMPTHRAGRDKQQDPIRLKNLINKAQDILLGYGLRRLDVQELLSPAESLLGQRDFWQHQCDGLAFFLCGNLNKTFCLPSRFDEIAVIAKNFHIKPLIPLISRNRKFYILTLSTNAVRLFLGTRYFIEEIELSDMPTSMKEALWMDNPEKHLDFHTSASSPGRGKVRRAMFHGHGGKTDAEKTNLLRYFNYVDKGVNDLLEEKTVPMLLAGVDYLLPIYHQANTFAGLLNIGLVGNPDKISGKDLHKLAWELIEPIFNEEQQRALEHFEQFYGQRSGQASTDLKLILPAAHAGQVEVLFVAVGSQLWGRFEPSNNAFELFEEFQSDARDLLDLATVQTLLNNGTVYALDHDKMPAHSLIAAIYRYEVSPN